MRIATRRRHRRTRRPGGPRLRRVGVAVILTGALATAGSPAHAGVDWSKARVGTNFASCVETDEGLYYTATGRVWLQEYGKSSVIGLSAQYKLYRTNVGAGWNFPRLTRTYRSSGFPNDSRSFYSYLPSNGNHQWIGVLTTNEYRLDVKAVWDRGWRRDWTYQYGLAYC